jgi:hypothetical protein
MLSLSYPMGARMSLLIIGGNNWSGTSNLITSVTGARQEVNSRMTSTSR